MPYEINNYKAITALNDDLNALSDPSPDPAPVFSLYGFYGIALQNILPKSLFYATSHRLFTVGGHTYNIQPVDVFNNNSYINFSITSDNSNMSLDLTNANDILTYNFYFEMFLIFDSANNRVILEATDTISPTKSYIIINNVDITETPQNIDLYEEYPPYQYDEWDTDYYGMGFQIDGPPPYPLLTI